MNLSMESLVVCANKFDQGELVGFEDVEKEMMNSLAQKGVKNIFAELSDSEMIVYDEAEEIVHLSALCHHILNMMISPEVFIQIENHLFNCSLKIYIKNSYYLCVLDDDVNSTNGSNNLIVELLPTLKEVVASFSYALYRKDIADLLAARGEKQQDDEEISIIEKAFERDGNVETERRIEGNYRDESISFKVTEVTEDGPQENGVEICGIDEFINNITLWMFDRLSKVMESEVK